MCTGNLSCCRAWVGTDSSTRLAPASLTQRAALATALPAGTGSLTLAAAPLPTLDACLTLLCLHLPNQHLGGGEPVITLLPPSLTQLHSLHLLCLHLPCQQALRRPDSACIRWDSLHCACSTQAHLSLSPKCTLASGP